MFEQLLSLSGGGWILAVAAMVLIGVSRTGFRESAFLAIPVFAAVFGARLSTAVVLIMYITADVMVIGRFARIAQWKTVLRLTPWAAVGVIGGTAVGMYMDDRFFARAIAALVLAVLILSIVREVRDNPVELQGKRWLAAPLGVAAGFTSMVGNAAGPLMTMYMLALGLDKRKLLGTAAWFFFFLNIVKLPFHVFVWNTVSGSSLLVNAVAIIPIFVGTLIGSRLSGKVSERTFRIVSFALAGAGAIRLLIA